MEVSIQNADLVLPKCRVDLGEAGVGELGFGALEERAHKLRPLLRGALRDRTTLRLSGGHADGVDATTCS